MLQILALFSQQNGFMFTDTGDESWSSFDYYGDILQSSYEFSVMTLSD